MSITQPRYAGVEEDLEVSTESAPVVVTLEDDLDEFITDTDNIDTDDNSYEARTLAISSAVSNAIAALDEIPSIIPHDNDDSGIFNPAVEALYFAIPAIPHGTTYGQTRSGRNVRNPIDKFPDTIPTGNSRTHGLGS